MAEKFAHLPVQGTVNYYNSMELVMDEKQTTKEMVQIVADKDTVRLTEALKECLDEYPKHNLQGAWLKIPKHFAWTLESAVDAGFEMHHAQKEYVMLTKWLNSDREDSHPMYAHHFVGVGGFVVSEHNQILSIREKYMGDLSHKYSQLWKLPGGHVDPKENFSTAVEREVWEETGIRATFKGILAFRHLHEFRYGCSDMYICCLLTAENTDNQTIKASEYEVHECKWVDESDFEKLNLSDLNSLFFKQYQQYKRTGVFVNFTFNQNVRRATKDMVYYCDPGKAESSTSENE